MPQGGSTKARTCQAALTTGARLKIEALLDRLVMNLCDAKLMGPGFPPAAETDGASAAVEYPLAVSYQDGALSIAGLKYPPTHPLVSPFQRLIPVSASLKNVHNFAA